MRLLAFFAVLCSYGLFAAPVIAADEFGARFSAEAPAALEDSPEAALSAIAPAAGDEPQEEEPAQAEAANDEPSSPEEPQDQ
jgi:hypothetical protein